ncbi:hypothetical protein ES705_33098 [subsurface metagenome]
MRKYLILTIALMAGLSFATYAQDEDSGSEFGTKAGDITGAILFGRGNFLSYGSVPAAPGSNSNWTVYGQTPYANTVNANDNTLTNIIGGEVRYFITNRIAVNLSGGAIIRNTPDLQNVQYFYIDQSYSPVELIPGNDPATSNQGWIPQYGSVVADNSIETNINLGGEYHFPSPRFNRLFPYVGAAVNYYYSRRSEYDPSVYYSYGTTGTGGTNVLVYDIGVRSAIVNGIGAQAVAGIDLYLIPGVYVGLSTRPVSYLYIQNNKIPGPGLETLKAESHTWSFFAQTFVKVGFILGKL